MNDETLTAAMTRLRDAGYRADLTATDDGDLVCEPCGTVEDPASMQIDETVRFEGMTDPGDAAILLAITCDCGARGLYTTAYGPAAPPGDSLVLTRLASLGPGDSPPD